MRRTYRARQIYIAQLTCQRGHLIRSMARCCDSHEQPNQLAWPLPRSLPLSMCSVVCIPGVRLTGNRVCSYLTHEVPRPSPRIPLDPDSRGTMHLLGRSYITRAHLGFRSANVEYDALVLEHTDPSSSALLAKTLYQ